MVKKIKAGKSSNYYTREKNGNYVLRNKNGYKIGSVIKKGSTRAKKITSRATTSSASRATKKVSSKKSSSSSSSSSGSSTSSTSWSSADSSSTTDSSSSTSTTLVAVKKEVLIDNYDDAYKFAKTEFYKARRDNKHTLECKVIGSGKWKQGKWAYCYIPDYKINMYMYITKASHEIDDDGKWLTSLTLQDYPPSLSSGDSHDPIKSDDNSSDTSSEQGTDDDGTNTTTTDYTISSTSSTSSTG